jgi:chromosome segregation ATPase
VTDEQLQSLFAGMQRVLEQRLDSLAADITALKERAAATDDKIDKVETTLLSEFRKWAAPIESRLQTHRSWFQEVDAEMVLLKERIARLEKRLGLGEHGQPLT